MGIPSNNIAPTLTRWKPTHLPSGAVLELNQTATLKGDVEDPDTPHALLDYEWTVTDPNFDQTIKTTQHLALTPTIPGVYHINLSVSEVIGNQTYVSKGWEEFDIAVVGAPGDPAFGFAATDLGTVSASAPVSLMATVVGGNPPIHWEVVDNSLPTGFSLNGSTGEITGSTAVRGAHSFVLKAYDSNSKTITSHFQFTVISADSDGDGLPDDWEQATLGGLDSGILDDNDSDGLSNQLEFALGKNPLQANSMDGVIKLGSIKRFPVEGDSDHVTVDFLRRRLMGEWSQRIEKSADLVNWEEAIGEWSILEDDGEFQRVRLVLPAENRNKMFIRMVVE